MDSTEKGTYVQLLTRFSEEHQHPIDLFMASSERIEKLLVRGRKDICSVGFSMELAITEKLPTEHLIESVSFNRIYTSILSRADAAIKSTTQLNNKTLVVYHGNYQDALERLPDDANTSVVAVYDLDTMITVVLSGRVEAGFVTTPDIFMSPLYQQSQSELHLVELPDSERRESLVCIDSDKNRALVEKFNTFINKLKKADELQRYIDYRPALRAIDDSSYNPN